MNINTLGSTIYSYDCVNFCYIVLAVVSLMSQVLSFNIYSLFKKPNRLIRWIVVFMKF